jgi:L-methionine (R)-S-oxide reductase
VTSEQSTVQQWLDGAVAATGAIAGTVHVARGEDLYLTASRNIPAPVLERVAHVPHGKGMAGLAQVQRKPVQTCNLQTDDSGRINPMAKLVSGQSAVALPVLAGQSTVRAVVGFAFAHDGEISESRTAELMRIAETVPAAAEAGDSTPQVSS